MYTVTYANTGFNLAIGLTRLTGAREPHLPGFDQRLRDNQRVFIDTHLQFLDNLARDYAPFFDDYKGMQDEAEEHHADPHPKRDLRIQAYDEVKHGEWCLITTPAITSVRIKVKTGEFGKFGKKTRVIGDLKSPAALAGFVETNILKNAQAKTEVHTCGGVARFVKSPKLSELHDAFQQLIEPDGAAFFCYFSDDSSCALRFPGGLHRFNLDIKSCDCSHTGRLFEALALLFPAGTARADALRIIAQCDAPVKLVCPEDTSRTAKLQFHETTLFSGSTLTTAVNNLANLLIFTSIMERGYTGRLVDGIAVEIVEAAELVGYQVTGATPLSCIEEIQFLKHSPLKDTFGVYRPQLNLGTLLRSFGISHGDVPGRGDLRSRADSFCAAVIQSAFPHSSNVVVDALRCAFPYAYGENMLRNRTVQHLALKTCHDDEYPRFDVDTSSLARRYGLAIDDVLELAYWSSRLRYGSFLANRVVDAVMKVDYDIDRVPGQDYRTPVFVNNMAPIDRGLS